MYPVDEGWRVKNPAGKFLNRKWWFWPAWTNDGLIFPTEDAAVEQAAKYPGAVAVRYFGETPSIVQEAPTKSARSQEVLRESAA